MIFQFTPLREGRRRGVPRLGELHYFNSRPSARGDRKIKTIDDPNNLFQFTPLREGRRKRTNVHTQKSKISIHAPPRGATTIAKAVSSDILISIHAPPRGATWLHMTRKTKRIISIHAPPRGATCPRSGSCHNRRYFNSRPSARGDGCAVGMVGGITIFQFTPLREGRPASSAMTTRC